MKIQSLIAVAAAALTLAGCLNMPTPPVQITGTRVSSLNYEQFDCSRLLVEQDALVRREGVLVAAQDQRVRTSQMQAFWCIGFATRHEPRVSLAL